MDAKKDFEELLLSKDFRELQAKLAPFNLFQALGVEKRELVHSCMLAFLMDPGASHGLGDHFVRELLIRFVEETRKNGASRDCGVSPIDVFEWNLDDLTVRREVPAEGETGALGYIDVLLVGEDLVVAIENKIDAAESDGQLSIYRSWINEFYGGTANRLCFFLTPDGRAPTYEKEEFCAVSHACVAEVVELMLTLHAGQIGEEVAMLMTHYVKTLRRHVVGQDELQKLCARIWNNHRAPLDMLMQFGEGYRDLCLTDITGWVASDEAANVEHIRTTKSRVTMFPREWERWATELQYDETNEKQQPLLCVSCISADTEGDRFKMVIELQGPHSQLKRDLWEFARMQPTPFKSRQEYDSKLGSWQFYVEHLSMPDDDRKTLEMRTYLRDSADQRREKLYTALNKGMERMQPSINSLTSFLTNRR